MQPKSGAQALTRRSLLLAALAGTITARPSKGEDFLDQDEIRFGLTPVFLNSDLELLDRFQVYLRKVTGLPILLVTRRTYQEITALLISRQLDAAWICGYPFVEAQAQLQLVAVPIWRGRPLYRSYIIVGADHAPAADIADLRGDIHAFSDPDSNSGWLVTNALLAERELRAETFFSRTFFTYGHRDVIRAVASGLADSGSVDGYVYEVISELEPDLTGRTRVLRRSEWLGFPPVAAPLLPVSPRRLEVLKAALLGMPSDSDGAIILKTLRLDGFGREDASLFEPIARKASLVAKLDQHA